MSFCEKCGAYIPMDESACPACGYDSEQERREQQQREETRRQQEQKESRQRYEYAGAQQQEYRYGTAHEHHSGYQQSREEKKTSGTGTANKDWQWNGGQRPLWEDPNQAAPQYEDYARKAKEWAESSVNNRFLSVLSYIGPLFVVPLFLRKNDAFARHHANQGLNLFLFSALLSLIEEFVVFGGLIQAAGSVFALICLIKGLLSVVNGRMDRLPLIGGISLIK